MTYTPSKPDAGPSPLLDAPTIQADFAVFDAAFSTTAGGVVYNHTAMNDKNQGDHEAVIMKLQSADPGVTENLTSLYAKNATSAVSTEPQLFVQIPKFLPTENDTTTAPNEGMQLTYNTADVAGPIYQSFLPGGYILYLGQIGDITVPITLVPTPTKILCVQAFPEATGGSNIPYPLRVVVTQPDTIKIDSSTSPALTNFMWMAIAKA